MQLRGSIIVANYYQNLVHISAAIIYTLPGACTEVAITCMQCHDSCAS